MDAIRDTDLHERKLPSDLPSNTGGSKGCTAEVEGYNEEKKRLLSFGSWPAHYPVNPLRLAKAGFYYLGDGDEVVCFSCGGHLSGWQYGDIVQKRHIESFPHCDFVNKRSNNVPLLTYRRSEKGVSSDSGSILQRNESHCKNENGSLHSENDKVLPPPTCFLNFNGFQLRKNINIQKMVSEKERLKTFSSWPLSCISANDLVEAGFFYLGQKDKVQCAFCHGIVKNWQAGDIPLVEHKRHFPSCEYVLKHHNIVLSEDDLESHSTVMGRPSSAMSYKLLNQAQKYTPLDELGVNVYCGPVHPHLATESARLRTFDTWPDTFSVCKESLVAAGFFYTGFSDQTKCFHCDGGLHAWESGDDPWVEHARWFQNCSFLRLNKSADFISSVIDSHYKESNPAENRRNQISEKNVVDEIMLASKVGERMDPIAVTSVLSKETPVSSDKTTSDFHQLMKKACLSSNDDETCQSEGTPKENLTDFAVISENKITDSPQMPENMALVQGREESVELVGSKESGDKKTNTSLWNSGTRIEHTNSGDQGLCKVCMDKEVSVAFLPCGHALSCIQCAPALTDCPACCKVIQATVRVYLP